MSPSRRERAKAEKEAPPKVSSKACSSEHPETGQRCWHKKANHEGTLHFYVKGVPGGRIEKVFW